MTTGPTFLLVGAARSGTTYLARQLTLHPQVHVTEPKEPHFLAFAGRPVHFTGPGDDESINRWVVTDEARWRAMFDAPPDRVQRGEGSMSTLYYAEQSVPTIQRVCPDVKMIALLRDPVERAFSAHQYWTSRGFETETFERGLDLEDERVAAGYHHIWHYTRMGHYAEQLAPFVESFPREQLLVLGFEELMADPAAHLDRCLEFLELEPWTSPELDLEVNAGGEPRSRAVAALLRRSRNVEPVRRAVKAMVPFAVRERIRSANLREGDMGPGTRARLEQEYGGEAAALRTLLGADAPGWARR